jgi:hypothetical protein
MTKVSTIQPFAPGDILVGATVLNNPDDDHMGDGRIIQYDSDLKEKGVLWTEGTSHLIGGLHFDAEGVLWAFDSAEFKVLRIDSNGKQLPDIDFPKRSFSNVSFAGDGTLIFGEHMVGHEYTGPPERLNTTLPFFPGSDPQRFGDGHVFRCSRDGKLLNEYSTETHGGMAGFLGVTGAALLPDNKTLIYLSELGNRVFRYDIEADKQLPDLVTYDPDSGNMAMALGFHNDGKLMLIRANFREGFFLDFIDGDGSTTRGYTMPGKGWASLGYSTEAGSVLIGNFFTGEVAKLDLDSGKFIATAATNVERSLAGIAQFAG